MASIRKRGDLQWEARIRRKGFPLQCKTFDTKAEAEAWASVIESEMVRGVFTDRSEAERTTLKELLERYRNEITPGKKGADSESSRIGVILKHSLVSKTIAAIRGADIAGYRDDRFKQVSAATVVRELAILSNVFNVARKEWGLESISNPVSLVRKPKLNNGRDRRLKPGELEKILEASESPDLKAIVQLAVETAMRRGEIVSLTWSSWPAGKKYLLLTDTKNGEARQVPLSSKAVELLKALPRRKDGRIFGLRGDSITQAFERARSKARREYVKACEQAGLEAIPGFLEDLRFHDLRHEAASRLFEKGLNPMEAAFVTGHKDLRMLKRYTHLQAEELAKRLG